MSIFKDGFTLILTRHGPGNNITFRISPLTLKILSGLIIVFIATAIYLVSMYGRVYYLALQCRRFQKANEELKISTNNLNELKKELRISENLRKKISDLLGIEKIPAPINLEIALERKKDESRNIVDVKRRDVPSILPVRGFISQGFSPEHPAIDIAAPLGTPIVATADGYVTDAGWDSIYGNYLTIAHGNYSTFYGHLYQAEISKDDKVITGQVIGYVGSTGESTSPHLHYEVRLNERRVDPRTYFIR